jgi:hypothetical protein
MKLIALALLVGAAALSGAAGPAERAASASPGVDAAAAARTQQCFRRSDVRNHTVGDARTLYFNVAGREVYRVDMKTPCLASASSSDPLIFENRSGSQSICKPLDLDITVSTGGQPRCLIDNITRLTPAEVAALPRRIRP